MLEVLDDLPPGLLDVSPARLHRVLAGPTLIHLPGRRPEPLFCSVLLHGDETTGFHAVQALLRRHRDRVLPRALSLFIGNVAAARRDRRLLDGQPDYNRIWAGGDGPEQRMAQQVLEEMARRRPFASIDIHNNSGMNPHYACINRMDWRYLHLATLFSRVVVHFLRPTTVQSRAFAELCPAATVECGQAGAEYALNHALRFMEACLHLVELPAHAIPPQDFELLRTLAIVKVPEAVGIGFGDCGQELCFTPHLDHLNFRELPAGTALARVGGGEGPWVEVEDVYGRQVAERYFEVHGGELCTRLPVIPAMLSVNPRAIRQDCLGYFMERVPGDRLPPSSG